MGIGWETSGLFCGLFVLVFLCLVEKIDIGHM